MDEIDLKIKIKKVEEITISKSHELNELVFSYGVISPQDKEWHMLLSHTQRILREWAEQIEDLGGHPIEGWKVEIPYNDKVIVYQLPNSEIID